MKPGSRLLPLLLLAAFQGGVCAEPSSAQPAPVWSGHPAASPLPGIWVGGRLNPEDVARLEHAGVRQVLDLTRDSETPGFDEAAAVEEAGLAYANLAIGGAADLTRANVLAFDRLVSSAERPLLVHCASGNRVGAMAALRAAWLQGKSEDEAVEIGRAWGLKGLEGEVRQRIAAPGP